MQTVETSVTIRNRLGLHARPAMAFVDTANCYQCAIHVCKGKQRVDGKSIMQLMMLAATYGTTLHISAEGDDAPAAISALSDLVNRNFGEDENESI